MPHNSTFLIFIFFFLSQLPTTCIENLCKRFEKIKTEIKRNPVLAFINHFHYNKDSTFRIHFSKRVTDGERVIKSLKGTG